MAQAQTRRRPWAAWIVAVLAACMVALAAMPVPAQAVEVIKLTARPNGSSGSDVMGGKETRLTWEGQAADDETVVALTFTLPDGTSFGTDDISVTRLYGDELMERETVEFEASASGQTLTIAFTSEVPAGSYFQIMIYGVTFPTSGGEMQITGTYVLDDGTELEQEGIPTVSIIAVTLTEQIGNYLEEQEWVEAWNSNRFLRLFLNPVVIVDSFPVVAKGFLMSLAIVCLAFPLAIPFGFFIALMRTAKNVVLRAIASFYVNIIRGTPCFLQIYIAYFGLPLAGINIGSFPLGVIVMAMNCAAYLAEIFRAGIQSIPKGQSEAARSLGMNAAQTMVWVIIPQMFKNVIPTLTSEFILLYKDTSLLAAVGVMEIVMYAKTVVATTGSITPYVVAALFYLVITLPLSRVVTLLERRLQQGDKGSGPKKKRKRLFGKADAGAAGAAAN